MKRRLLEIDVPLEAGHGAGTLEDALAAMRIVKPQPFSLSREICGAIAGSRIARLGAGVAAIALVLSTAGRLKTVALKEDEGKRLAEVVDIGVSSREGSNHLCPFVVVPVRLKTRDGRLWDEKQTVQFRRIAGHDSCLVYGPYGMVSEVK